MAEQTPWHRALDALFRLPPYRLSLRRRTPAELGPTPPELRRADALIANQLFQGHWNFAGISHNLPNGSPWAIGETDPAWLAALDGFAWLRHFAAAGGDAAKRHARALLRDWIGRHRRIAPPAWRADILGRRLLSWLGQAPFLLDGADAPFRAEFLASLSAQGSHLARVVAFAPPDEGRLVAAVALVAAARALPGLDRAGRGRRALERELARQILGDGGHVARNPSVLLTVLADLVALKLAWQPATDQPPALIGAIDRMAPMLRFFRHGDGGLALFNGATDEEPETIDRVLEFADADGQPLTGAPHSGFQRLAARRSLLLVDTGSGSAHAGALSFEFSHAKERLVVNCGAGSSVEWRGAAAHTAAHSTLALADTSSVEPGRSLPIAVERTEEDGNLWLDLAHEGYLDGFGLTHRRRLWLAASGEDLRGEDRLLARPGATPAPAAFAVRFHLHPDVRASLVQAGVAVLLQTGAGVGFRFRTSGGRLALEDSVYLGHRRSQQVVIHGTAEGAETVVKWALQRIPPRPRATRT
jgi:uncharacterized heparinase superfamily protein